MKFARKGVELAITMLSKVTAKKGVELVITM